MFTRDLAKEFPASIAYNVLLDSVRHLAGEKLTFALLDETCWRLAGNLVTLKRNMPAYPWTRQPIKEWVPAQIIRARRRKSGIGKPGWAFQYKIMAGTSTGLLTEKFWSDKFCRFMSSSFGFAKRRPSDRSATIPRYQFQHPTEFVTLRAALLIDPKLCGAEPGFEKIKFTPSLLEFNREQLRYRDRLPMERDTTDYSCPRRISYEKPCYLCPYGFVDCRVGTHRLTYTFEYCTFCSRDKQPFDADVSTEMCVVCYERRAIKR